MIETEMAKTICKMGQGASCCSFLLYGESGFECAKQEGKEGFYETLKGRRSRKAMLALSNNCSGPPIFEIFDADKQEMIDWIDGASYEELLRRWRNAESGEALFIGAVGRYYKSRMDKLRTQEGGEAEHVRASKAIGWEGRNGSARK